MPLDLQGTSLAQAPYYDDYAESKNFHRVLFKPSVAVQARELTQLQTILQNQIERFGDNIYRTGTIIKGCALTTDTAYYYVKINDLQTTGTGYTLSALSNTYAIESTTGLQALVVNYAVGGQQLVPDMNTLYLKYLNTGTLGQKTFGADSILKVYDRNYSIQSVSIDAVGTGYSNTDYLVFTGGGGSGATANIVTTSTGSILTISITSSGSGYTTAPTVSVANSSGLTSTGSGAVLTAVNYLAQVQVANTSYNVLGPGGSNTTGIGTAIRTTEGVIYQKGHFVRVEPHEVILSKYNTSANGVVVGFVTNESIVNSNADSTLLDNAGGASNYTAPGADRLKLTANLTVYTTAAAASANGFLSLYEYENGQVVKDKTTTQFNSISKELSRRTYEESGNYVVRPFTTYSEAIAGNTTHINVVVQPGIAYVEGSRVETLNNTRYPISKANTYLTSTTQSISTSYGGYVFVKEAFGSFDINQGATVYLRSAYGLGISNGGTTPTPGIQIGTARVRSLVYDSGTPGSPNCVFRLYLFDVRMSSSGFSFKDVKAISDNASTVYDIVQDPALGYSTQYDTDFDRLVFPSGTFAVRDFTNERVVMRTSTTQNFAIGGSLTVSLSGGNTVIHGIGTLNSIQERDYIVIPQANIWLTTALSGTVATLLYSNTIIGTGTSFSTQYNVGDYFKVAGGADTYLITAITSNTQMQIAVNATATLSGQNHYTAFRQGVAINLAPPSRTIQVTGTNSFVVNLGGTISSAAAATVYYDYQFGETAEPSIRTKTANTYYVKISNTAIAASVNGPWSLGVPDAVELTGVYIGTGTTYPDPSTSTNYASQFVLDSGQNDNYYGLATIKRRPGSNISLGINNNIVVKFKALTWGPGYYLSTESYTGAIDDATSPLPSNKIRTYQIPVYVSPKTGDKFDLRDSLDFRPLAANTVAYVTLPAPWSNGSTVPTDPAGTITFDATDKRFPSPTRSFTAQISSYLARKDRVVVDKYGRIRVLSGVPSNAPSAPVEPEDAMTLSIVDIPQYPSLGAIEASEAGRPDLAVLTTPVQNRRFTMKDIGDIETRISRLEYYSLLNTLETQTKQLVLPSEANNSIERFKNGFFVDPMTDYRISNLADPEYRILIDTNEGVARPYFYDAKINLSVNATSTGVVRKGDVVVLNHTESVLLQQPTATRDRTLVDKLWSFTGNVRTFPEFDNWHDTETRDTLITVDIYSPISDLAAATSAALSTLKGSAVLVSGPKDVGTATQISGGDFGDQVWRQTTQSQYKDTKVTLSGGASTTQTTSIGTFLNDVTVQKYIRSQRVFFLATGLRPGATHYVFFEKDLMTTKVTPHSVPLTTTTITRDSFTQIGALGSALVANSSGCVAGSIDIPASTYFIGERSVVIMDVDNTASETTATSRAIGRFTSFGISTASTNLSISTKTVDTAGSRGYGATTYFSETYPVAGERWYTRTVPWPDPLSQTFMIQPQTSLSDGLYLTSVDLFFKTKDPVQGVTVEVRETLNGVPTQTVLPFSRTYLPSSSVSTSATGTTATTFTFSSPVYVRTNTDYAIVIYPDSNSPEYRIFTSVTGQRDLNSTNTIATQNWGAGTLFYSTSGTAWTPVQDEDLKFTLRRARFSTSTGTAVFNNGDYEFFTVANTSSTMRGGEDVAQLSNSYFNVTLTTNTSTNIVNTSVNMSSSLAAGDNVLIVYGTAAANAGAQSNVTITGTSVANASAGDTNTNFTTNYTQGQFVRFGNSTVGEIRQIVSITNASSMAIDAPLNGTTTNIQQYPIASTVQVSKIASINTTAMVLSKNSKQSTSVVVDTGTIASVQKVVAGVVDSYNYTNNTIYISNSTAANSSFKFLTANSTYLATIVGDTSQASARVVSIDNLNCNFFTPLFSKVVIGGTSLSLTSTVTKSGGSTDSQVYEFGMVNKFEFSDAAMVKSKSNEIVGTVVNKSFTATIGFNAPTSSDDTSPMLDVNPIGMVLTKNVIDNEVAEIVCTVSSGGPFVVGEFVTQAGTGAIGTVVSVTSSNLVLKDVIGKFMARASYTLSGATSSTVAVAKQVFDETTRFGRGKSKYISKRLALADGMDAEDIKVFLTSYKPFGTEVDVYARILNFTDGQSFEEKDWTKLDQVTLSSVYSDSLNDQDFREYEYTFPYSPPSIRKTGIVSANTSSATVTGVDTLFSTEFAAGDLIKVVRTNTATDYEMLRVNSVANNTSLTATTTPGTVVTGGTIELVTQPNAAFKYNKNSSIVRYYGPVGTDLAAFDTYKYLAIKIVLRSPYTYLVPTVNDVRALAVSI